LDFPSQVPWHQVGDKWVMGSNLASPGNNEMVPN